MENRRTLNETSYFCKAEIALLPYIMVLSISLDTFYSNKNYAARKI